MNRWKELVTVLCLTMLVVLALATVSPAETRRGPLGLVDWNGELKVPYPSCRWPSRPPLEDGYDNAPAPAPAQAEAVSPWLIVTGVLGASMIVVGGGVSGALAAWKTQRGGK